MWFERKVFACLFFVITAHKPRPFIYWASIPLSKHPTAKLHLQHWVHFFFLYTTIQLFQWYLLKDSGFFFFLLHNTTFVPLGKVIFLITYLWKPASSTFFSSWTIKTIHLMLDFIWNIIENTWLCRNFLNCHGQNSQSLHKVKKKT